MGTVVDEEVFDVGENLVDHLQADVGDDPWVLDHVGQAALDQLRVAHLAWIDPDTQNTAAQQPAHTDTFFPIFRMIPYYSIKEDVIRFLRHKCVQMAKLCFLSCVKNNRQSDNHISFEHQ